MRISDWSSDVCSSDLFLAGHRRIEGAGRQNIGFGPHDMPVMGIERIHHSGFEPVDFARSQILAGARSLENDDRPQMVDRKSGVSERRVSVSVDTGGRRFRTNKKR